MSRVTTLFLLLPCLDDEREAVDDSDDKLETPLPALRQYCKATNALRCLPMPVSKEAGGPKHIEVRVYAWGANFLDLGEFLETVAKLPWDQPERVQVMFQEQDDEAFTLLDLGEARVWREAMVDRFQTPYGSERPELPKIGDKVMLKSGGPEMTVTYVGEYSLGVISANCSWSNNKGGIDSYVFPVACLKDC